MMKNGLNDDSAPPPDNGGFRTPALEWLYQGDLEAMHEDARRWRREHGEPDDS